jgi:hypothetical protein
MFSTAIDASPMNLVCWSLYSDAVIVTTESWSMAGQP